MPPASLPFREQRLNQDRQVDEARHPPRIAVVICLAAHDPLIRRMFPVRGIEHLEVLDHPS